jgi:ERCC4-type nuclease
MEQKAYTFKPFRKWFAEIERRKLCIGDYSIAGLEDTVAVERKFLEDLFNCCSPYGSREAFVWACERLSKLEFAAFVIEGSITKIIRATGCNPKCFAPARQGTTFPLEAKAFKGVISAIAKKSANVREQLKI